MWLAAVPIVVIMGGRGAQQAIVAAWALMGALVAAFVVDGFLAAKRPRLRLYRETPAGSMSIKSIAFPGLWRTKVSFRWRSSSPIGSRSALAQNRSP